MGAIRSGPLLLPLLLAILLAPECLAGGRQTLPDGRTTRQVESLLDKLIAANGELDFERLHEAVVDDQEAHYMEPVKSLRTRQTSSLNGLYDFCFDVHAEGFKRRWFAAPLADLCEPGRLHRMPVPSAFNEILSRKEARDYMGWFWYQTELGWPAAPLDANACNNSDWLLQFDSINYLALIWAQPSEAGAVKFLGSHAGGHLPVVVDLSELARFLCSGAELRLTIAVSNQLTRDTIPSGEMVNLTAIAGKPLYKFKPDFDFFHFAGLMGDVHLVRLPKFHVRSVSAAPLEAAGRLPPASWQLSVCFNGLERVGTSALKAVLSVQGKHKLHVHVEPDDWAALLEGRAFCLPATLDYHSQEQRQQRQRAQDMPTRRRVALQLAWERQVDVFEVLLAERLELAAALRGPGQPQLQGFGMHQEQLFSGRAMSLAAIMKDLHLARQVGANVLRTSHYPYSSAYLDACDELGLMVVAECAAVGLRSFGPLKLKLHKQLLGEMLRRDSHHPAIVMWSVANEPASEQPEARAYFESLLEHARTQLAGLLGGRPLTAAIAQSHETDRVADLLDVLMVNRYYAWYDYTGALETIAPALRASLAGWARKLPGKPLLVSEFGADTLVGLHSNQLFSEQFQRALIEEHERLFDELASERNNDNNDSNNKSAINFLGAMIWNFADFATHDSLLRPGGNRKGVFTADRQPKLAAESVARIYRGRLAGEPGGAPAAASHRLEL